MISKPLISICIPCYNSDKYIKDCIESGLNQTYENIEVIVLDNMSTDNSWSIISNISNGSLRKFQNEKNIGMVKNFKKIYKLTKGEYITFLCSDDKLYKDAIQKLVSLYQSYPDLGFIYSNIDYKGSRNGSTNFQNPKIFPLGEWSKTSIRSGRNPVFLTGTLFKKDKNKSLIQDLLFFDWYMWLELGQKKVGFIVDSLGTHHYNKENETARSNPTHIDNYLSLCDVLFKIKKNKIFDELLIKSGLSKLTLNFLKLEFVKNYKSNDKTMFNYKNRLCFKHKVLFYLFLIRLYVIK